MVDINPAELKVDVVVDPMDDDEDDEEMIVKGEEEEDNDDDKREGTLSSCLVGADW